MAFYINLTKHPERAKGMGLSMSVGSSTPPEPPTPKYVHYWDNDGEHLESFTDNKIPTGYYSGRTDIYKVLIEQGVTLSDSAFRNCTNLSSITTNQTTLVASSFRGCTSLVEANLNRVYFMEGWVFSGCTSLTSVTLPDTIISIGGWAFGGCTNLEEVTVLNRQEDGVSLGNGVFAGCSKLDSITSYADGFDCNRGNPFSNEIGRASCRERVCLSV